MSIISRSYFKGELSIGNIEDVAPNSNSLTKGGDLDLFIVKYERDILIRCLGYALFKRFNDNIDASNPDGLVVGAEDKWDDLLNGKEYDLNGVSCHWRGIRFTDGELKRSLIANYTYCKFLSDDVIHYSGIGMQREQGKNSVSVSGRSKYVASWREFIELTEFSNCNNGLRSLYDFITDMNHLTHNTYENWIPERFETVNNFGL